MKTFKQKLLLFVCAICAALILMLELFAGFLLEPAYMAMTRQDLIRELDSLEKIIRQYGLLNETGTDYQPDVKAAITAAVVDGQCIEFSSLNSGAWIGGLERISNCTLHTERVDSIWTERHSVNNLRVISLRATAAEEGSVDCEVEGQNGIRQYVVGRRMGDQGVVVLLSVNLERISQAASVMQRQLAAFGLILLSVALLMAYLFANWFTRPITALSAAARQMARGDYNVSLPVTQKDEIGVLTEDFNAMAREIGRTDALQKDLIANVSHDLRTPLTLIKGYAETVRDLSGEDKQMRDGQLNIIISETDRLSALVGSVMELSRLNAGTEKFEPVTFDISDFCEEIRYRYADSCAKNGWQLLYETPGERLITADPELMSRVLHNLLSNAFSHIGADGVVVLRVSDTAGEQVLVEVEDHGSGIDADELPHVFERYYRARQANGRKGAGLGLSIVRAILVTHRFPFGVRSAPDCGSVFWFSAPVTAPTEAAAADGEE